MSKKLGVAVFAVMACSFGPMTAGAQGHTSVKVGKDGSVKVRAGSTEVDTQNDTVKVRAGNAEVDAEGDTAEVRAGGTVVQTQDDDGDVEQAGDESRIEISNSGETSTHRCTPDTEVEINGASNTVKLTGECKSLNVTGADNKVKVEAVSAITVTGSGNTVTWKRGHGKSKPKISSTGVNNKVSKGK